MMYNCSDLLEQPFMGTVSKIEDLIIRLCFAKITPATGYNCTTTPGPHCIDECGSHSWGILDDYAPEANIHWRRPIFKKCGKVWRWCEVRRRAEKEATDVKM
jgi:hypothetical protein